MQRARGFTLIEIALSIFILLLILVLAVPSFSGVIANRRLKQSLDDFNDLVRQAQTLSVTERRPYLIVWSKNNVMVRPEAFAEDEEAKAKAEFRPSRGSTLAEWIFWPSGACEPAVVRFQGPAGSWTANYSPLTGRPEITSYAVR